MSDHGSTLPRRQLGRYLREGRMQCNMTIAEAAALMEWSESKLQRLETGNAEKIRVLDVRELCRIYDFDDEFATALVGLAQQASVKSWWHEYDDLIPEGFNVYVGLEASARALISYQPDLIPGLLQTTDYARVLISDYWPDAAHDQIDRRVQLKMRRQSLVTRKRSPATLDVVIHETALRRVVGNPRVMAAQLRRAADMSTLPTIAVRVLPFSAGVPTGHTVGPFVILEFGRDSGNRPVEPTVVYLENFLGDLYLEKQASVDRYHQAYQALQQSALDEATSRDLLRKAAKEYAT
ncbi:helix-turn-helix domain-containing protein [Nocardia huaxiensis]|uniref:Helix-turn-helix domain-containing protein n=1 Tax=Nocardia huaxiensis TaxID=2755382 RepID=A0A7D6Z947_9NOCA|nr:helix-turn-helix transcriptional regulator [Nocardia huaxiensis]QLY30028.1 helix-turn-helix domain-containing protein [Nocardia huaxiensis]UFS96377.1 helix-turn-helix domain-containing protein [Nocardia huaxiensis]